jgi:UDP-2,4-diacetamido-2,4,6-trideoxy-beta-L-altropyranose hydrolase
VDGDDVIGLGHITRCVSIAEAFDRKRAKITFLSASLSPSAQSHIQNAGFTIRMLQHQNDQQNFVNEITKYAAQFHAWKLITDLPFNQSPEKNQAFIKLIKGLHARGISVAIIDGLDDDCASMQVLLPAHVVIAPYLNAEHRRFLINSETKLLAGAQYFPFAKHFAKFDHKTKAVRKTANQVLISYGGGDVRAENSKLLDAFALAQTQCAQSQGWHITITGEQGRQAANSLDVKWIQHANNMPELLFNADFAVLGSGLVRYEAIRLGTPSIVFSRNSHHAKLVEEFAAINLCVNGGILDHISTIEIGQLFHEFSVNSLHRKSISDKANAQSFGGADKIVEAIMQMP